MDFLSRRLKREIAHPALGPFRFSASGAGVRRFIVPFYGGIAPRYDAYPLPWPFRSFLPCLGEVCEAFFCRAC